MKSIEIEKGKFILEEMLFHAVSNLASCFPINPGKYAREYADKPEREISAAIRAFNIAMDYLQPTEDN